MEGKNSFLVQIRNEINLLQIVLPRKDEELKSLQKKQLNIVFKQGVFMLCLIYL